jgi:hypothetical protein
MYDLYQGTMNTVSPAFGGYNINVFIDIDRDPGVTGTGFTGTAGFFTGPGAAGVTGTGSLESWSYGFGITGVQGVFTTNKADTEIYF